MRRLVLKMSMSLDGYVAGPDGRIDWLMRTLDSEATAWIGQTLRQAGAHLVGRRTYADMLGYWPTSTEPLAAPMNTIPKIVFSRSGDLEHETTTALRNATDARREAGLPVVSPADGWAATRVLGTDLAAEIAALKAEPGQDLLAHGGASFARSLVGLGLVDEYRLLVHPVVLGSGLALFSGMTAFDLAAVHTTAFPGGAVGIVGRPLPVAR
ncbi:dihydrofolate reductase family protein [Amycolatopsis saalfeldensis]|uniref:Dihydrofolate reductase n=1 Tax=Amycolatopsis saalfeldensis TaxID=394193 RepID=A0A1H8T5A4_9PSEU|nr:dihydrofolate reductase family protein [Amycolatopsis saalfeldensis]SEO85698.1 Dihydrofolate reductase [Amycolatopsis saalfeldensis]